MRILLLITGILFLFSSCQMQLNEARIVTTKPQPYLQLVDGTVIHTHKVEWNHEGFQKEFVVNNTVYPAHNVAFYSDGVNSFANVHGKNFAEMISEGKIDVYKTQHFHSIAKKKSGYGAGPYIRHNTILDHYYLRDMQTLHTNNVFKLNYNNLQHMIAGNSDAHDELINYRHQRKFTTVTACIGGGLIIGGAALTKIKSGKTNFSGIGTGVAIAGAGITVVSLAVKIPYKIKLFRILNFYN